MITDLGLRLALTIALSKIADYPLQSSWMAQNKTSNSFACLMHVLIYTACFLFVTQSPAALFVIGFTHFLIDRFRLAKYVAFASNFLAPPSAWPKWEDCSKTGYHKDIPESFAFSLMISVDNSMHLLINLLAVAFL